MTQTQYDVYIDQPVSLRLQMIGMYLVLLVGGTFLMLLVMTFNVGILLAVISGQTIAYAIAPKPIKISDGIGCHAKAKNIYAPSSDACCGNMDDC